MTRGTVIYDGKKITFSNKRELEIKLLEIGVPKNNIKDRAKELIKHNLINKNKKITKIIYIYGEQFYGELF